MLKTSNLKQSTRTLADLAGHDPITSDHLLEAVNFRTLDRNLWL